MTITRRSAIKAITSAFALPALNPITSVFAQSSPEWTTYEIVTEVNLENTNGAAEAWIPLPLVLNTDYFKALSIRPEAGDTKVESKIYETPDKQARMLWTKWEKSASAHSVKVATITSALEPVICPLTPTALQEGE